MTLKELVGSGDTIMLATLPFIVVGVIVNLAFPSFFEVGGPSATLRIVSIVVFDTRGHGLAVVGGTDPEEGAPR